MSIDHSESIRVCGHQSEVDSFCACVQAAMDYWGRDVPYDCIAGLSGAAFSPALDPQESCAGVWMEAGADVRIDFLAHALGFDYQRLEGDKDEAELDERAREIMQRGGVVICNTRPCWSVITRWDSRPGRRRFAAPRGCEGALTCPQNAVHYVLVPSCRSLSSCESLYAALGFGAIVASRTCCCDHVAFGGRLYEAWLERLDSQVFCPGCGDQDWRCAERTTLRAMGTQRAAIQFLNRAYSFIPGGPEHELLRDAACTYAAMAASLAPYARTGFRTLWNEPDLREAYGRDVRRLSDLHGRAADFLSTAVQH